MTSMGVLPPAVLELSLDTAEKELRYTASKCAIELVSKDEDIRRLRAKLLLSDDDAEELRDQLQHEQDAAERVRQLVDEHLARAQTAEALLETNDQVLRKKEYEIEQLQVENRSLRDTSHNVSTILAEKLALGREISTIRPQLEHLQAQTGITEELRSEKLALQRQLSEAQCELEAAKADARRAQARRRNTTIEIAQEEQVADLKKELARERRLRVNAEELAEQAQSDMKTDDVRHELVKEKKLREKLEQEIESLQEDTQLNDVRRDLAKAQKTKHRLQDEVDNLRTELERERKSSKVTTEDTDSDSKEAALMEELRQEREARSLTDKTAAQREERLESEKAELESKLNQFRAKLREKKEELKTTQAELVAARESLTQAEVATKVVADYASTKAVAKQATASKRSAVAACADEATLGTPGNGPSTRKARQTKPAAIGEKSSFSITPFLNKTAVLDEDDVAEKSDAETSPTANKQTVRVPLAPAASIKSNRQPKKPQQRGKKAALPAVVEEDEIASQKSCSVDALVQPTQSVDGPAEEPVKSQEKSAAKRKQKPRKSLTDFKSFQKDDEPVKQKKRRLGARAPTLFDDEDDSHDASKPSFGSRGLFGPAAYAKLASSKKPASGVRGSILDRSTVVSAAEGSGFQFSPLKRSRKNFDDTLRG